jgi:hypothetical protein
MERLCNKIKDDRGALIVEATLSLPFFIFTIFLILSITNICYVQAKVGSALASAAKEISQYSYIYYLANGDGLQQGIAQDGEEFNSMLDNANTLANIDLYKSGDAGIAEIWVDIQDRHGSYDDLIGQLEGYKDDPASLLIGAFSTQLTGGIDGSKDALGGYLATLFMRKNLVETSGGDPNRFLRSMNVVDGLDGINCQATLFPGGETRDIKIAVSYKVQMFKFLGLDFSFDFAQTAQTQAWGLGAKSSGGS